MTIHALVPYNETLSLPLAATSTIHQNRGKTLASDNPDLAAWYEQASQYYSAVLNGAETQPAPEAWQEFLRQLQWAEQQLNGGGWDPSGTFPPADGTEADPDPFGGAAGPMGNVVHSEMDCRLGFVADGKTHDVFAYNFTLDVASPSALVSVDLTTDTRTQPPEENVARVVVKDPATGTETVYWVHGVSDLENFSINTPKAKKVNDASGLVTVGEFVEGSTGNGGGIPESAEIDGDTARYDGVAGTVLEFSPPFGGIANHEVNADLTLQVKNSDQVSVARQADGGYRIVVTDTNGETTCFNVPAGFQIELNAHAENVRFKEGPSVSGELAGPGGKPAAGKSGSAGVPEGWEHFSLNGSGPEAGPEVDLPPQLLDLLDLMGIDPNDPDFSISPSLIQEIEGGVTPPSDALLAALQKNDAILKAAWQNYRSHPGDDHALAQVRDRLVTLLSSVFPGVSASGEFPEGVEADAFMEAGTLFFGDAAYQLGDDFRFTRLTGEAGDSAEPGAAGRDQDALANAQMLSSLPAVQWSAEEIVDWAKTNDVDLSYIGYPPSADIWQMLFTIDREFQNDLKNWRANPSYETIKPLRNHIIEMFQALYPGMEISDNGSGNNRRNDIKIDGDGVNIFPDSWISHQPDVDYSDDVLWRYLANHFNTND